MPKKIKLGLKTYHFCKSCGVYEDEYEKDLVIQYNMLNDEVEIIEEQQDIDVQNLEQTGIMLGWALLTQDDKVDEQKESINFTLDLFGNKLNEIAKNLNKMANAVKKLDKKINDN